MKYSFKPKGVCCREITCDIDDGIVTNINFNGGCPGNLKMISKILDGWKIEDIIKMCKGNLCGFKNTSCCDQFALLLEEVNEEEKVCS